MFCVLNASVSRHHASRYAGTDVILVSSAVKQTMCYRY